MLFLLLLAIIIVGSYSKRYGYLGYGKSVLERYDFNSGAFVIVGLPVNGLSVDEGPGTWAHEQGLGPFYVDDIEVMNKLKGSWIAGGPEAAFACGYNYYLYVIKHGKIIETFAVTAAGCNTINTNEGIYSFYPERLNDHKDSFKKATLGKRTGFESVKQARQYMKDNPDVLMAYPYGLPEFDGFITLDIFCGSAIDCIETIESRIKTTYKDEPFELQTNSLPSEHMIMNLWCNKELGEKFNLFKKHKPWAMAQPHVSLVLKDDM